MERMSKDIMKLLAYIRSKGAINGRWRVLNDGRLLFSLPVEEIGKLENASLPGFTFERSGISTVIITPDK